MDAVNASIIAHERRRTAVTVLHVPAGVEKVNICELKNKQLIKWGKNNCRNVE